MPLFTSILTTAFGSFATTAFGSFLISTIANVATSALVGAILGQKQRKPERNIGIKGQLEAGGDLTPRFPMGKCRVDGQLIYHNTWGESLGAPNGWQSEVIKLSDLPGPQVLEFYVNGAKVVVDWETTRTIAYNEEGDTVEIGSPVPEFASDKYGDNLWIKVYDGSQTTADEFLQFKVQSEDRPYGANRIGTGIVYAIVTHRRDPEIFSGFPKYKFVMSGVPLYDPSKDSTVTGGSGSHRWNDWSTWGGDGDDLPAVQVYNLLRGVYYKNSDEWMCGLQRLSPGRLRNHLIPAINKCRATVAGIDGDEPMYRSGFEMDCSVELRNVLLELEKACAGRISEQGGIYDMAVGAPGDPVGSFDDGMIVGTATEEEEPFKSLQATANVVIATYPEPEDGWQMKESPPVYSSALEASDGSLRLPQEVEFVAVPYAAQVQRLTSSALAEARRFRTHTLTLPGEYVHFEPNDVLSWTSAEKGYDGKSFRIDAAADLESGDVTFNLTEVDPADYDPPTYKTVPTIVPPRKDFIAVVLSGFQAEAYSFPDKDGQPVRPGIRAFWIGGRPDFRAVRCQVRTAGDEQLVINGVEGPYSEQELLISGGLSADASYEIRALVIPSDPFVKSDWTTWIAVSTNDDRLGENDLADDVWDRVDEQAEDVFDRFSTAFQAALDRTEAGSIENLVNTFLEDARVEGVVEENRVQQQTAIEGVVATLTQDYLTAVTVNGALAQLETDLTASIGTVQANVNQVASALATTDQSVASLQTTLTAEIDGVEAWAQQTFRTEAQVDTAISDAVTIVETELNGLSTDVSQVQSSVDGIEGVYGVKINNNGAVAGFGLISTLRDGGAVSDFILETDNVYFRAPGSPVSPFVLTGGTVYLRKAMIKDADVDVLKLAGNAAIGGTFADSTTVRSGAGLAVANGYGIFAGSISVPNQTRAFVLTTVNFQHGYLSIPTKWAFWLRAIKSSGGLAQTLLSRPNPITAGVGMSAATDFASVTYLDIIDNTSGSAQPYAAQAYWYGENANIELQRCTISVLANWRRL